MLSAKVITRLKAWAELQSGITSLWLFGSTDAKRLAFAVELRPTMARKHDWGLAEFASYGETWKADISKISKVYIRLVKFRDISDRPFTPGDATLIWERTKPSAEVKD